MFIKRKIEETVREVSRTFPVLLLSGPRQVGKTTLLESLIEDGRKKVSLDNLMVRALAKEDPELFLQRYSPPVMIDEIQYAPELLPYIKILVDERKKPGDFWLTGSQMFKMMKDVSETLAGRVGIIPILGLSNSEIEGNLFDEFEVDIDKLVKRLEVTSPMGIDRVFDRIFKGSMPRLYELDDINLQIYFNSYIDTYISRDIRDLKQVADLTSFMKFIRIVAARTASNLNYETLAQETGISSPTAKSWLSILISSGLVILIEPFFNNALKRLVKTPRMYFADTGLCAHLMGWTSGQLLENSAMSGAFFETWLVTEIYKSYLNVGKTPPLYFYRDSRKKEIDLLIFKDGIVNPIEIKKASAPKGATKNFSVLYRIDEGSDDISSGLKIKVGKGAVVCMASDLLPIDRENWYVPAWLV